MLGRPKLLTVSDMATLKRGIGPKDGETYAKRVKPSSAEPAPSWGSATLGATLGSGSLKTGHLFTVEYIATTTVPCLKFTSLAGSVTKGSPCQVHEAASAGQFVDVLYMPVRGVLDVLQLALTGDRELVKDRGYDAVLPRPTTRLDDNSFYNLVSIGAALNDMIVPGSSTVRHCVNGMWSVYKQHRGPLFIACDVWVDWEGSVRQDRVRQDHEDAHHEDAHHEDAPSIADHEEAPASIADDSGVESAESDDEYAEVEAEDTDDDDEDYDETFVFPLCHSYQLSNLLNVIQLWLATQPNGMGLLVDCKVPEHVTLVPMPREEDKYKYTGLHWPELRECEIKSMNEVTLNVVCT